MTDDLHAIVGHVPAAEAERIARALRRLRVPATIRAQLVEQVDPDTGEVVEVPAQRISDSGFGVAELFEVLVPEPFVEISLQVLDATTHEPLGDATEEEILADLAEVSAPPPARTERRGERTAAWIQLAVIVPVAAWIVIEAVRFLIAALGGR